MLANIRESKANLKKRKNHISPEKNSANRSNANCSKASKRSKNSHRSKDNNGRCGSTSVHSNKDSHGIPKKSSRKESPNMLSNRSHEKVKIATGISNLKSTCSTRKKVSTANHKSPNIYKHSTKKSTNSVTQNSSHILPYSTNNLKPMTIPIDFKKMGTSDKKVVSPSNKSNPTYKTI